MSQDEVFVPKITGPRDEEYDLWILKSFPHIWDTMSHLSCAMSDNNFKMQANQISMITDLTACLEEVNVQIENDIRLQSNNLKHNLECLKATGWDSLDRMKFDNEDIFKINFSKFENARQLSHELIKRGQLKINEFYGFLQSIEKFRSERFKEILRAHYKTMVDSSTTSGFELQLFFERQILHINQMLLNNLRCYTELQTQLTKKFDNDIKLVIYKIGEYQDEWKLLCKDKIFDTLSSFYIQIYDVEEFVCQNYDLSELLKEFTVKRSDFMKEMNFTVPVTLKFLKNWYNAMNHILEDLDSCARQMIKTYQMALEEIISEHMSDFNTMAIKMIERGISSTEEIEEFNNNVVIPHLLAIRKPIDDSISDVENGWSSIITRFIKSLQYINFFLSEFAKILSVHENRIKEVQELVKRDVDQTFAKNDKALKSLETSLNVAIDIMRQEANEKKMSKSLEKIHKLLDKIKNSVVKFHDVEIKVVNKYYDFIQQETNLFMSELKCFLRKKPLPTIKHLSTVAEKNNEVMGGDDESQQIVSEIALSKELKSCEKQIAEIDDWKQRLWESIENYIETCKQDEQQEIEAWVNKNLQKVNARCENTLIFHHERYPRIETEIYQVRLQELKEHADRLQEHKKAVDNMMKDSQNLIDDIETKLEYKLEATLKRLREISDQSQEIMTTNMAASQVLAVTSLLESQKDFMSEELQQIREKIATDFQTMMFSNYNFLQEIKLFSEGGNFNPKEAITYSKKISALESEIKNTCSSMKADINELETRMKSVFAKGTVKYCSSLNNVLKALKFNETFLEVIKTLQENIKSEVYVMKLTVTQSKAKFGEIRTIIKSRMAELESMDKIAEKLQELYNTIATCKDYLDEAPIPCKLALVEANGDSKSKSKISFRDYKNQLFENPVMENLNRFMPKISKLLYDATANLQDLGMDFYSQNVTMDNHNFTLAETYDVYMMEIVHKMQNYYYQCGSVWLEQIKEFTSFFGDFMQLVGDFIVQCFDTYHKNQMKNLNEEHLKCIDDARMFKIADESAIKKVYDKLKPLHGYPENAHMLNEVKQDMEYILDNAKKNFKSFINIVMDKQTTRVEEYEAGQQEVAKCVDKLYFEDNFAESLMQQAEAYLRSIDSAGIMENEAIRNMNKILYYDRKLNNFEVGEYSAEGNDANDMDMFLYTGVMKIFVLKMKLLTCFREQIKHNMTEIQQHEELYSEDIKCLEEIWHGDIKRVKSLYKVKYP